MISVVDTEEKLKQPIDAVESMMEDGSSSFRMWM